MFLMLHLGDIGFLSKKCTPVDLAGRNEFN